jgi:uncharacterized membrane protein
MAEEKKKDSKSSSSGSSAGGSGSFFTDAIFWVLFGLVLIYVVKYLIGLVGFSFSSLPSLSSIFASIFGPIQVISIFLSLVFILGLIYVKFKMVQLANHHHGHGDHGHSGQEHNGHHGHDAHASGHGAEPDHVSNKRWESILTRMSSTHEADWRLAIIECDILLNDMLLKMGYRGESIAEKLKQVEKSDFHTLDEAWEAHKTRNRIAHSGSEYHLSRSEAEKTFKLYKEVFEEFFFI